MTLFRSFYVCLQNRLFRVIGKTNASEIGSAKPDHDRHHAFISQPDHFLKISRKKAGYGSNKMGGEVLDNLTKALKERLFSVKRIDPKHPYSGGTIFTLKGTLEQSQLKAVFDSRHMIAAHYIIYVLSNEAAAHLYASQTGISYQDANKILVNLECDYKSHSQKIAM